MPAVVLYRRRWAGPALGAIRIQFRIECYGSGEPAVGTVTEDIAAAKAAAKRARFEARFEAHRRGQILPLKNEASERDAAGSGLGDCQ